MRYARAASRVVGAISFALGLLGTVMIGVIAALIVADVLGRFLFNSPVRGAPEIAKTSVTGITFLMLPYAMRRGRHVRSSVVIARVPERARIALDVFAFLAGAVVFALVTNAAWEPMIGSWEHGEYEGEGALRVPIGPTRTVIVVASALMVLECLNAAISRLADLRPGGPEAERARA